MPILFNQTPLGINVKVDSNPTVLVCSYTTLTYDTDNREIILVSPTLSVTYKQSNGIKIDETDYSNSAIHEVAELLRANFNLIKISSEIAATYASINTKRTDPRNILVVADETNAGSQSLYIHNGNIVSPISSTTGSSSSADLIQTYTSGTTVTVSNATNILYVNPAATVAALTITLPATPHNSNEVQIYFGGTLTSGAVINSLIVSPNSGQTLLQATAPTSVNAGESIIYKYNSSTSKWYRKL